MSRDPSGPIRLVDRRVPKSQCGYALDFEGEVACGKPAAYRFRMTDWPRWRFAHSCPEHAQVVRHWAGLEYIRSLPGALVGAR